MVTSPQFSFLTTAFRTEQYLPKTIESVRAQTRRDWEIVVVDNGNSDVIADIVEQYSRNDDRIRLVRQENKGYRGGVMAAAYVARGRYVCVLDSDDQLMPTFCAEVGAVLDGEPEIDAVGIDAFRFSEPEDVDLPMPYMRSIGVTTPADPRRSLTMDDVIGGRIPYYTAAIRRAAWDSVGGYEPGIADVDESVIIWCRLVDRYDVRLLPTRLARYRLRPDSISREPTKVEEFERQLMRSFVQGANEAIGSVDRDVLDKTLRGLRYHQAIRRARYALIDGDTGTARSAARAALSERRTARAVVVLASVNVAPRLMRNVHPVKAWLTDRTAHVVGRLRQRARSGC